MATYVMFGKYTVDGMHGITKERNAQAKALITKYGGQLKGMYVLLGEVDLLWVVELPGNQQVVQLSLALSKLTGIDFATSPVLTAEEVDAVINEVS